MTDETSLVALIEQETRTPLAGIVGSAEILLGEPSLAEETRELAAIIHRYGLRLLEFVHKAVLLAELGDGAGLRRSCEPVASHLRVLLVRHEEEAAARGVTCLVEAPDDLDATADWRLLDEVLGYLLRNALEHSPRGGTVSLAAEAGDGEVRLLVRDEGAGINPVRLNDILSEPVSADLLQRHRGRGLSLAVASRVIEAHGGRLEPESPAGGGAVFALVLPEAAAADGGPAEGRADPAADPVAGVPELA